MAATVTITKQIDYGKGLFVFGTIALTGSYSVGGETFNLNAAGVKTTKSPDFVDISSVSGFLFAYNAATGKIMIFGERTVATNASLIEMTAVAYSGLTPDMTAQVINFMAIMPKLI